MDGTHHSLVGMCWFLFFSHIENTVYCLFPSFLSLSWAFVVHKKTTTFKGNFQIPWQNSMWYPEAQPNFGGLPAILSWWLPLR